MSRTFTEEDFQTLDVKECQQFWGLSNRDMRYIKEAYVGRSVTALPFSEDELHRAGWESEKQYKIHAAIRNW